MTKSDYNNLEKCPPNKWFTKIDVWPSVKRPEYSLNRLVDAGKLETRYRDEQEFFKKS